MTDLSWPLAWLVLSFIGVPLALIGIGSFSRLRARTRAARRLAGWGIVASAALLSVIGWWVARIGPGMSGVVASGASPEGREYIVVQTFKGLIEPYQVSLYVRDDAWLWRWHYLEHQDNAWRKARVDVVGGEAVVHRNGEHFADLELVHNSSISRPKFPASPRSITTRWAGYDQSSASAGWKASATKTSTSSPSSCSPESSGPSPVR